MYPVGLVARCKVLKRRLRREFDARPAVTLERECRWRKIGVSQACNRLAQRYGLPSWKVVQLCHPYL